MLKFLEDYLDAGCSWVDMMVLLSNSEVKAGKNQAGLSNFETVEF